MILILPYHLFKISEILKNLFNNGLSNPININIYSIFLNIVKLFHFIKRKQIFFQYLFY